MADAEMLKALAWQSRELARCACGPMAEALKSRARELEKRAFLAQQT